MSKLTEKVEAMDSKLDKIISLLIPGHGDDAKKGEKSKQSNPDDVDPQNSGNKDKEATFDAAKNFPKQLTHVAGQGTLEVNPNSGKSGNKATSDSAVLKQVTQVAAKEGDPDLLIDSVEEAAKLYQALEIKGNIHKVHYKDPDYFL